MRYSVIKAQIEKNKENIIAVKRRNLGNFSELTFFWKYRDCPFSEAFNWLAQDQSGNFVGMASIFPRKFSLNGELLVAGVAGDFAVDKKHRAFGPALQLQKTALESIKENNISFIYSFPNKHSAQVMVRAGYVEIGRIERFVKLLKTEHKFKKYIRFPFIAKLTAKIIDLILKVTSSETQYNGKKMQDFNVENLAFFDKRFDRLWEKCSKQFRVMGERTSDFLNWRYKQCPINNYEIFIVHKKGAEEIIGYIVYYVNNDIFHIIDMLSLDLGNFLDILIAKFIIYSRKESISLISIAYFGNNLIKEKLRKFGFYAREKRRKVLFYKKKSLDPRDCMFANNENWYLLIGDEDDI